MENQVKNQEGKLWAVYHLYEDRWNEGSQKKDLKGIMRATDAEMQEFLRVWDKPVPYGRYMCVNLETNRLEEHEATCHHVVAEEIRPVEFSMEYNPYLNSRGRDVFAEDVQNMREVLDIEAQMAEPEEDPAVVAKYEETDALYERFGL